MSAASRIFGIAELLEEILSNLGIVDLTHCRRICKSWKHMIADSKPLRRISFLEPVTATKWLDFQCNGAWKPVITDNPNGAYHGGTVIATLHPGPIAAKSGPELDPEGELMDPPPRLLRYHKGTKLHIAMWIRAEELRDWVAKHAMTDVLLTQPPCSTIVLYPAKEKEQIQSRSFFTLGEVCEALVKHRQRPRSERPGETQAILGWDRSTAIEVPGFVLDDSHAVREAMETEGQVVSSRRAGKRTT